MSKGFCDGTQKLNGQRCVEGELAFPERVSGTVQLASHSGAGYTLPMHSCSALKHLLLLSALATAPLLRADDWPQWLGPQRDSVWREAGIVEKFPEGGPKVRWRVPVNPGFSGPAVAGGRVFVTDHKVAKGAKVNEEDPFDLSVVAGTERVLCLDEATGKAIWQHEYDAAYGVSYNTGPRATPVVSGGRVFTLGTEGHLLCLDAKDGKVVWWRQFKKDFGVKTPLWGFAAHPLLDGDKLICLVGGNGTVAVAFHKDTGKELWRALTAKQPGYAPPAIIEAGGRRQLIIWHAEALNGLDPETGRVFWSIPASIRSAVSITMPRQLGDLLYVTSFYNGSLMVKLDAQRPGAEVLWATKKISEKDTTHLNALMTTPFLEAGHLYGVCNHGQFRCLEAATGRRVWEDRAMVTKGEELESANAFIVKNGSRFFLCAENGDLIIATLSPTGVKELSRTKLLAPTLSYQGRDVVWSHPAFANGHVIARNDKELVSVDLRK
ncbi:MAG: pyrrolo-quinoline quinone repeat-containing protein [Limisphaerales bacterium]|nr:MAG: pyrrolo-quinoline quinone repeat-containing protein [Limisphaerales bacterium]KAG0509335.1 MAG: pyrrolo-quinoline quinone repeat-containing protein [Limisphaerales bacterium]TXT52080.1 MAG: pyrrolo-quinoline quinone repeat-containing protein [Limisphaerales bacterium]